MTLIFNEERHEYRENGIIRPSVNQILKAEGYINDRWFTKEACARGTAVHTAVQLLEAGQLDWSTVDETVMPRVMAYESFRRETDFEPLFVEAMGSHPHYLYAGRPDLVGILNGFLVVPDIKTGARQDWMALQLAGYVELLPHLQGYADARSKYGDILDRPPRRYTIELGANERYHLHEYDDRGDRGTYLSAVNQFYWKLNHNYPGYSLAA